MNPRLIEFVNWTYLQFFSFFTSCHSFFILFALTSTHQSTCVLLELWCSPIGYEKCSDLSSTLCILLFAWSQSKKYKIFHIARFLFFSNMYQSFLQLLQLLGIPTSSAYATVRSITANLKLHGLCSLVNPDSPRPGKSRFTVSWQIFIPSEILSY